MTETELSPLALALALRHTLASGMAAAANMVEVAAQVGDTARATMLSALVGGQALTATELANCARISKSTASSHLAKLVGARLLTVTQKRRNRYYRIASPLVAKMLESIKAVAAIETPTRDQPRSAHADRLRAARSRYDHFAGQFGVEVADTLVSRGYVVLADDGGEVTNSGAHFLSDFGIALTPKCKGKRIFCRPCLDWSERRYHIAGHVGAVLLRRFAELGWLGKDDGSRAVTVTATGKNGLRDVFGIE